MTVFNVEDASKLISARQEALALEIVERHYAKNPDLSRRWGAEKREKCLTDARFTLSYLACSLAGDSPVLFADYLGWLRILLAGYGIPPDELLLFMRSLQHVLSERLPPECASLVSRHVAAGLEQLAGEAREPGSPIAGEDAFSGLARRYIETLLSGKRTTAFQMVLDAVELGMPIRDIYLRVFEPAQVEIGRLWQMNRLNVAQEHYCTAATQLLMAQLYPRVLAESEKNRRNLTMFAACASGDLHEIGLRMVSDFFEMDGWNSMFLGATTPTRDLVAAMLDSTPDLLALSATMPYHLSGIAEHIQAVQAEKRLSDVRILVGGRPFLSDPSLYRKLGADATAPNARAAVDLGGYLCTGVRP
jgi:methanogenic corrinoid protein MtbC1